MSEPVAPQQNHHPDCPDSCEWMDAYMVLRAVVVNQANAAMPVKLLGGAVTVTEANLARDLCMSLEAVQKMIRDFGRNVLKIQDAQDQAERRITML